MSSRSIKRRQGVNKKRSLAGGLSILAIVLAFVGMLGIGAWMVLSS